MSEQIHGFRLIKREEIPDYASIAYTYVHERTGLEIYFLSNKDKECFFTYDIYTPPEDSSGVFHILEHTLLTGSKKYPVRDPFMMMVRNSCYTFLNAMTGPDRTYFPAASPVKKDFDNIFKVYSDAVFAPLLRRESFEQEGIRLTKSDGVLAFEGVVFSEMQGDISQHESVVSSVSSRELFDNDSPYRNEFGGNPPDICDLSYEKFIATYKKYYVPSNMKLFFYGDLDINEKLEYLDREYLRGAEIGTKIERAKRATRWSSSKKSYATSMADSESEDGSTVMVSWLLGDCTDPRFNTELSLVVDILLSNPGSPLYKAIVDSELGRDLSSESGMSDSYRELIFAVGMIGSKKEDADQIESYILASLRKICSEGLDPKNVEATLRRNEFRLQEIGGSSGYPQGYMLFFTRLDKAWMFDGDPSSMLRISQLLSEIREALKEDPRYFENWIERNIINNSHRLVSVVTNDKSTQSRMKREIDSKIKNHAGEYSEREEEAFRAFSLSSDSREAIANLPRLEVSDIPNEKIKSDRVVRDRIIYNVLNPCGRVIYADIAFDVSDFSYEELEDLELLSKALLMVDVGSMSYAEFSNEIRFSTGAVSIQVESGSHEDGRAKVFLFVRLKALEEYFSDALSLLNTLFNEAKLSSEERLKATLLDIESTYQASAVQAAQYFALSAAAASTNPVFDIIERIQGIAYWNRVAEMEKELDILPSRLEKIRARVFTSSRVLFHLACSKEYLEGAIERSESFIDGLKTGEIPYSIDRGFSSTIVNKAYTLSSPVNYIALAGKFYDADTPREWAERVFFNILSKNSLWALIREQGGAYGVGLTVDSVERVWQLYTYRDPRLDDSISDFERAIREEELTSQKLEDVRLAILSRDVKPVPPQYRAFIDFKRYLYGIEDEERFKIKDSLLGVTLEQLEDVRERLLEIVRDRSAVVIGDARAISNSSIAFECKSLPLR